MPRATLAQRFLRLSRPFQYLKYKPGDGKLESIEQDEKIQEFERQTIKYTPTFLWEQIREPGVYTLLGPRQVGKSTAVKLFIRKLLAQGENPRLIFFFNCDILKDYEALLRVLEIYLQNAPAKDAWMFLDEVSFVEEWPRAVKHLVDRGDLAQARVLLTGSVSLRVKGGAELLPGRRGEANRQDFTLLPLTFRQWCEVQGERIDGPSFTQLLDQPPRTVARDAYLNGLLGRQDRFVALFNDYLLTGGFLQTLNKFRSTGAIADVIYRNYWQWIEGDLLKVDRRSAIFLEIMQEAIKHLGSTFGYHTIAKQTSVQSHVTVADYLDLAEKLFVMGIFPHIDLGKKLPALRKQKKIAFTDPFLFHLVRGQLSGGIEFFASAKEGGARYRDALVEGAVAQHLKGTFLRAGFWRDGREIDFIGIEKNRIVGVEVKMQPHVDHRDVTGYRAINQIDRLVIASQDELKDLNGILVVPYWILLLTV